MEIVVSDNVSIADVQERFNKMYPYLRIEFFSGAPGTRLRLVKPTQRSFGEFAGPHKSKREIIIRPGTTVSELSRQFSSLYGLSIKVVRKSGKLWIGSTLTDSWTLEQQNREGEMLSGPL